MKNIFCTTIIVAAGTGSRMGSGIPKQFLTLDNKPIIAHTIDKFEKNNGVDEIIIAVGKKYFPDMQKIIAQYGYKKIIKIVEGSTTRTGTVTNALKEAKPKGVVLIHDGVRPFVKDEEISQVIAAAHEKKAAILATPVKDTIKEVTNFSVDKTLDRTKLWAVLTPQGFTYDIIKNSYKNTNNNLTDDASVVENFGVKVHIIEGSDQNIKITTPSDLIFAKNYLKEIFENSKNNR